MSISPDRALRTLLALLATALLAFGAAACGSDDDSGNGGGGNAADTSESEPLSNDEYLEEVNKAQTDFATQAGKLNLANPSSPKGFKKSLDRLVGLIDTLTQRLDAIEPPESVASQHDDLVGQLNRYGNVIEREKGDLASGDQQKVVNAAKEIQEASTTFSTDFSATITEINKRLE